MSIQSVLGQSVPIVVEGRRGKLQPLGLYQMGMCESSYIAFLRRQTLESTIGLPINERIVALQIEAENVAALDADATPVIEWIVGTSEGLCRALSTCIEMEAGKEITSSEAGRWYMESGRDEEGSPTYKWLIASRLRSDPSEAVSQKETSEADASDS